MPTFEQIPECANLAVEHVSPDFLVRYTVRGRPNAPVLKYNAHLSCGKTGGVAFESMNGDQMLDANGELVFDLTNMPQTDCADDDVYGLYESWAVVDGIETNHVQTTLFNSSCTAFDTCTKAQSFCGQ